MEEQLIFEIWDTFKDYIPEKSREVAASQYLDFLVGNDVELKTIEGMLGYDPHLDSAVELVLEEYKDTDDIDEDDDDDYSDEDEDY